MKNLDFAEILLELNTKSRTHHHILNPDELDQITFHHKNRKMLVFYMNAQREHVVLLSQLQS